MKSTTTVYGASSRDPAMFTEDMEPRRAPRSGYAKDVAEIEGYVRGFARRRPDVRVTTLRCANVIGPHVVSPLTSYFRLPVIPTVLGFDARLQFLHEQDLLDVLHHAVLTDLPGTFNVAGDGVLMLSQAMRRLQRPVACPCPASRSAASARCCAQARLADFSPEQLGFLTYGRGVDTTRMREELGFEPAFTTAEAFADFGAGADADRRPDREGRSARPLDQLPPVEDARQPTRSEVVPVGDAEIIPIGTRGRPGRGTGQRQAVRGLAQPRRPRRRARKTAPAARTAPAERPTDRRRAAARAPAEPPAARPAAPRAPATTEEREPAAGIPAGDWLLGLPARRHASCSATSGSPSWPSSSPSCAAG